MSWNQFTPIHLRVQGWNTENVGMLCASSVLHHPSPAASSHGPPTRSRPSPRPGKKRCRIPYLGETWRVSLDPPVDSSVSLCIRDLSDNVAPPESSAPAPGHPRPVRVGRAGWLCAQAWRLPSKWRGVIADLRSVSAKAKETRPFTSQRRNGVGEETVSDTVFGWIVTLEKLLITYTNI